MRDNNRKAWLYKVDKEFVKKLKKEDIAHIIENIRIEISLSMFMKPIDPDEKLHKYFFQATYYDFKDDEDDDDPETFEIAFAEAIILNKFESSGERLIEMCDADSGDLLDAYAALYDDKENLLKPLEKYSSALICYLAEFIVNPQFEIVQAHLLRWIINYFCLFSPVLVTLPVPSYVTIDNDDDTFTIERDFDEKKTLKLRRFFTGHGFFPLRDTDYMYHIFDYSLL